MLYRENLLISELHVFTFWIKKYLFHQANVKVSQPLYVQVFP
jgi:hypothetical protein